MAPDEIQGAGPVRPPASQAERQVTVSGGGPAAQARAAAASDLGLSAAVSETPAEAAARARALHALAGPGAPPVDLAALAEALIAEGAIGP